MRAMKLSEIAAAVRGELRGADGSASGVSIDSRSLTPGDLFVAIRGPRFDGHRFIAAAATAGAAATMATREHAPTAVRDPMILVADTGAALLDLAGYYRRTFAIPVVGLTGTNGKTTTKEMIAAILSMKYTVLKNQGNLNNQYGIPLSLFQLGPQHQAAVLELGMSALGEIRSLCAAALPETGVITNVGEGHTEFLKNIATVGQAKAELFEALPGSGTAITNADDPWAMKALAMTRARRITFGIGAQADVRAEHIKFTISGSSFMVGPQPVTVPMLGGHNVYNALAALAVGDVMGVPRSDAAQALAAMAATPMRLEPVRLEHYFLINDAYNANPASMRAALETLADLDLPGRKVAILGDMLELGEISEKRHWEIGYLAGRRADAVFSAGRSAAKIHQTAEGTGATAAHFDSTEQLIEELPRLLRPQDVILVKASRGMRFELIVNAIKAM